MYQFHLSDNLTSKDDQGLLKRGRMYGLERIHTGMCLDVSEKEGQKAHIIGKIFFFFFFLVPSIIFTVAKDKLGNGLRGALHIVTDSSSYP